MSQLHMLVGIGLLVSNAIAAAWGAQAWLRKEPSIAFWPLLRVAQAFVAVQALLGLLLLAGGERASDDLHLLYGLAPLLISLLSEGTRASAAMRELDGVDDVDALDRPQQLAIARSVALAEIGVMTIGSLLILTLALRAYQTGS